MLVFVGQERTPFELTASTGKLQGQTGILFRFWGG